jgi:hypothetical protein
MGLDPLVMGLDPLVMVLEPLVYCPHKLGNVGLHFGNVDGVLSGYLFNPIEGQIHLLWGSFSHNGSSNCVSHHSNEPDRAAVDRVFHGQGP